MTPVPVHGGETCYLGRGGETFGPYSWEEICLFGQEGNLFSDDLIWSQSLGKWVPCRKVPGLKNLIVRKKKVVGGRLLLAIIGVLFVVVVAGGLLLFVKQRKLTVVDYYPREGPAGSFVIIELSSTVEGKDLRVSCGNKDLSFSTIADRFIGINTPLAPSCDEIALRLDEKIFASLSFQVKAPTVTPLYSGKVRPSEREQRVQTKEGISVTIPGGILDRERTLAVSKVKDPALYRDSPFEEIEVYEVSIEGMTQLPGYIEIVVPYDPKLLDRSIPVEANFSPARWDEKRMVWEDLYFRVDETNHTLCMATDHLSAFWTGFSLVGLGKTAAIVAVVGGTISEVAERWANDKYLSRNWKIRVLYSDKALRTVFPDDEWKRAIAPANLHLVDTYDSRYSAAVQDIAFIFEESLKRYTEAGFPDPTKKGVLGAHIYTRYVKVKIDSLYNYYIQQGEMAHDAFWDTIHVPTEIIRLEFFDPVTGSRGSFSDHFQTFKSFFAHELFHVIQRPYYGMFTAWTGTPHKWWMEATAEWAGNDLAKIPYRSDWDKDTPSISKRIGNQFLHYPINSTGKIPGTTALTGGLEYEYLAPVFVRYLVTERGFKVKELIDTVAGDRGSDPLVPLRKLLKRRTGENFDDFYLDFSVWLLKHCSLRLSDFSNPSNRDVAASQCDTLVIDAEREILRIFQSDLGHDPPYRVRLYRNEEGRENLNAGDRLLLTIDKPFPETYEIEAKDGDTLYFIAANGSTYEETIGIQIQSRKEEKWDNVAYHTMKIEKEATAGIWAVRISSGTLKIEPEKIEDAEGYREYEFDITASSIAPDIEEVTFVYDFGDGKKESKGKVKARVEQGEAEARLKHSWDPSPGVKEKDEPIKYVLAVDMVTGGKIVQSASSEITVGKAEVTIQPPRILVLELADGVSESSETFTAAVTPMGKYRFEWDFDDGEMQSEERPPGRESVVQHTYRGLKPGDTFSPRVALFSKEGILLAEDAISIRVTGKGSDKKIKSETLSWRFKNQGTINSPIKGRSSLSEDLRTIYNRKMATVEVQGTLAVSGDNTENRSKNPNQCYEDRCWVAVRPNGEASLSISLDNVDVKLTDETDQGPGAHYLGTHKYGRWTVTRYKLQTRDRHDQSWFSMNWGESVHVALQESEKNLGARIRFPDDEVKKRYLPPIEGVDINLEIYGKYEYFERESRDAPWKLIHKEENQRMGTMVIYRLQLLLEKN
ncbi:MAG TPA: GYF domain-containing protein [Thermoanaerobaculia bacterium]|nr:GYF domain-containing protein [Thermoanaerobaculia bacterium]HUM30200.1 GYF domain-containing protein [Thermoanaerobaculia bacterium]HXK68351.1 GYF domain-containing protein [Thermoanaerobaculia bacterium]